MSDIQQYLATFEELRRRKRWTTDTMVLRFAALTMASLDTPASAAVLEQAADMLKAKAGWFGALRSVVRYCVAAIILRAGLHPETVAGSIETTRAEFRKRRLVRGSMREVMAALVMVLRAGGQPASEAMLNRMQEILAIWKRDHWWLTGVDDYPLAALHAGGTEPIEALAARVEEIYQGLRVAKFSRGNALQTASQLLAVSRDPASELVARFRETAEALRAGGLKVRGEAYDELALLTVSGRPAATLAGEMIEVIAQLREARPRPTASLAFSLAAGLVMNRGMRAVTELVDVRDLASVANVQAILDQQAAAAASAGS